MVQQGENVECSRLWIKKDLDLYLTHVRPCWVTLAKCFNLSVPLYPHQ